MDYFTQNLIYTIYLRDNYRITLGILKEVIILLCVEHNSFFIQRLFFLEKDFFKADLFILTGG